MSGRRHHGHDLKRFGPARGDPSYMAEWVIFAVLVFLKIRVNHVKAEHTQLGLSMVIGAAYLLACRQGSNSEDMINLPRPKNDRYGMKCPHNYKLCSRRKHYHDRMNGCVFHGCPEECNAIRSKCDLVVQRMAGDEEGHVARKFLQFGFLEKEEESDLHCGLCEDQMVIGDAAYLPPIPQRCGFFCGHGYRCMREAGHRADHLPRCPECWCVDQEGGVETGFTEAAGQCSGGKDHTEAAGNSSRSTCSTTPQRRTQPGDERFVPSQQGKGSPERLTHVHREVPPVRNEDFYKAWPKEWKEIIILHS